MDQYTLRASVTSSIPVQFEEPVSGSGESVFLCKFFFLD